MRPRTYIFAVAVEDYEDTSIQSVVYAEQDAQSFVEAWQRLGVEAGIGDNLLGGAGGIGFGLEAMEEGQ